jgi:hypothetical protein
MNEAPLQQGYRESEFVDARLLPGRKDDPPDAKASSRHRRFRGDDFHALSRPLIAAAILGMVWPISG